ncbi:MAG TPA: hypothetical protein VNX27_11460 [Chthoniobacterales bacterium]|jgi:hypothetical protein|nr:hypothetical protein [Chthoniobacterales bacterium]
MANVLNVVLSHQPPADVDRLVGYWNSLLDLGNVVIAYGGPRSSFDRIAFNKKIFIGDPNLRTQDHQREAQSYTAVFKEASLWLRNRSDAIHFVTLFEFDHLPLVRDLNARQVKRLQTEGADVLAYHLARVDDTSHPHYLHYAANGEFIRFFRKLSVRDDPSVVLSMFGTGSCWTHEAFDAIGAFIEPFPVYFEIYLPTLAHHLGFRLRDYGDQNTFVSNLGDRSGEVESAKNQGAWTLHPVKTLPASL